MAIDHALKLKKQVLQVETGLTHPILWMSGKSKNEQAVSRVLFPLPGLSRKFERDSAHRVKLSPNLHEIFIFTGKSESLLI